MISALNNCAVNAGLSAQGRNFFSPVVVGNSVKPVFLFVQRVPQGPPSSPGTHSPSIKNKILLHYLSSKSVRPFSFCIPQSILIHTGIFPMPGKSINGIFEWKSYDINTLSSFFIVLPASQSAVFPFKINASH